MVLIFLQRGVSIRASLQQRGELDLPCICELPPEVSIRASLQQRGEPCRGSERAVRTGFQSAPHFSSEANTPTTIYITIYRAVSIRASLQQRGERSCSPPPPSPIEFQSAPHFSSEANLTRCFAVVHNSRFNPRLTSAARRTP